ncbi:MAG: hypothetical protein HN956_00505 [Rhodospirillaceae bacterium]|nr:hypothetical protein [Rhodospirillaceae bacterium]
MHGVGAQNPGFIERELITHAERVFVSPACSIAASIVTAGSSMPNPYHGWSMPQLT